MEAIARLVNKISPRPHFARADAQSGDWLTNSILRGGCVPLFDFSSLYSHCWIGQTVPFARLHHEFKIRQGSRQQTRSWQARKWKSNVR